MVAHASLKPCPVFRANSQASNRQCAVFLLYFQREHQDFKVSSILGDATGRVRILEMPVQHVPLSVFAALEAGDILFVDSTHVVRTGSDVCFELFEVLPCLARGVLVHIHDMFWPLSIRANGQSRKIDRGTSSM